MWHHSTDTHNRDAQFNVPPLSLFHNQQIVPFSPFSHNRKTHREKRTTTRIPTMIIIIIIVIIIIIIIIILIFISLLRVCVCVCVENAQNTGDRFIWSHKSHPATTRDDFPRLWLHHRHQLAHNLHTHCIREGYTMFLFFFWTYSFGWNVKCQRHLIRFSPFFSPCPFFFFQWKGKQKLFHKMQRLRRNIEGMTKRKPFSLFFFAVRRCQKVNRIHTLPRRAWDAGNLLLLSVSLSPPQSCFLLFFFVILLSFSRVGAT